MRAVVHLLLVLRGAIEGFSTKEAARDYVPQMPAPKGPHRRTREAVLATLLTDGKLPLPDLSDRSGIGKRTLRTSTCEFMAKDGWLERRGDDLWGLGPNAQVFALSASRERVRGAVVDGSGEVLGAAERPAFVAPFHTTPTSPQDLAHVFAELARESLGQVAADVPAAVTLSYPGKISHQAGGPEEYATPVNGWDNTVRLIDVVKHGMEEVKLGRVPIVLVNDADAELLAEARFGVAVGARVVLGIKVSGGIGSAVVVDGRLHEGPDGSVGEIGHLPVPTAGIDKKCPPGVMELHELQFCSCDMPAEDHLERFASGRASVERLVPKEELAGGYDDPASRLSATAARGPVRYVLLSAGRLIGRAIAGPWLLLEPETVVVSPRPWSEALGEGVATELAGLIDRPVDVRLGRSPDDGGDLMAMRGAAAYVFDQEIKPRLHEYIGRPE